MEGLLPTVDDDGSQKYSQDQAIKASCLSRQDVISVVASQHAVLKRLHRLEILAIIGLLLLAYICIRLT